jgi:ADP-dependent phosphofructokinase/glucokinase
MNNSNLKKRWFEHYQSSPEQLAKMSEVNGLISAFNANIDAVIKVSGEQIENIIDGHNLQVDNILSEGKQRIKTHEDAFRGLVKCFKDGIC